MPQSWQDIGPMGLRFAIVAMIGLGCGAAVAEQIPLPHPRPPAWLEPLTFREAAGPDFDTAEVTTTPSACRLRLEKVAAVEPMPRLIGPSACGGRDMVQLNAVLLADSSRVDIKPAPVLRCEMADTFAAWIRDDAAPRVSEIGAALQSVDNYDDFECRGRNRIFWAKLSEHGKGNAIDVRSLTLTDGRVVVLTDMTAPKELRSGLRASACARFTTVLGPGSDGHHEGHIHLDIAERHNRYSICEWDVREPPPPPTEVASARIPLPPPRPANLGAPVKHSRKL